jgi:hypothetical protein
MTSVCVSASSAPISRSTSAQVGFVIVFVSEVSVTTKVTILFHETSVNVPSGVTTFQEFADSTRMASPLKKHSLQRRWCSCTRRPNSRASTTKPPLREANDASVTTSNGLRTARSRAQTPLRYPHHASTPILRVSPVTRPAAASPASGQESTPAHTWSGEPHLRRRRERHRPQT